MKILITDGSYKHSLGILVSLRSLGHEVDFIGDRKSICNFADGLGALALQEEKFHKLSTEAFSNFFSSKNYDAVLPIGAKSVRKISECCKEPYVAKRCIVPTPNLYDIACNKHEMSKIASQLYFDVPKSTLLDSYIDVGKLQELPSEIVIKGVGEEIKVGPFYFENHYSAAKFLKQYSFDTPLLAQERVAGVGVGYFGFFVEGKCITDYMHKRIREYPITGGVSCAAELYYNEKLVKFGRSLLEHLKWNGVAMVEFKFDEQEQKLWFIELNPKFWGSHDLALSANINIPVKILKEIDNNQSDDQEIKLDQLRFIWPLDGDLNSMFSSKERFYKTFLDLMNPTVKSNLHWKQPKLFIRQLIQYLKDHLVQNSYVRAFRNLIARLKTIGFYLSVVRLVTEKTGIPFARYSRIEKNVWLGPQHSKLGKHYLQKKKINACLSLRAIKDDTEIGVALQNYLNIPVNEYHAPTASQLVDGARFIKTQVDCDQGVYVHCREGISRAAVFVAGYLILYKGHSAKSAIELIKKRRPFINILMNQQNVLIMLDKSETKNNN